MLTIISGTNRPNSSTKIVADWCKAFLDENNLQNQLIDLCDLNTSDLVHSDMYNENGQHPSIKEIQEALMPSNHWIILSPEYNGSFPGILKLFIDKLSVKNYKSTFSGKKVALIGVASGRAGNLRGLDHLTGVMNYLNVVVMPNKLPISSVKSLLQDGKIVDKPTIETLTSFMHETLEFAGVEK